MLIVDNRKVKAGNCQQLHNRRLANFGHHRAEDNITGAQRLAQGVGGKD